MRPIIQSIAYNTSFKINLCLFFFTLLTKNNFFFFKYPATSELYPLTQHDARPNLTKNDPTPTPKKQKTASSEEIPNSNGAAGPNSPNNNVGAFQTRSENHTAVLQ